MKKLISNFSSIVILSLILVINVFAQDTWKLGSYSFNIGVSSGPLNATMEGARGLGSFAFVGAVGGVAFEAIAIPDGKLQNKSVELKYDNSKPDGRRLFIIIGKNTYNPFLPDWQLVPIAKYADSEYNACVSLFGPKTTETVYDIVYHSAFENTLLGLRLLQADIILMDLSEFWQLPKFNNKLILGLGETEPEDNETVDDAIEKIIDIIRQEDFQSWVYTDYNEKVRFKVETNFMLTGYPYYYFWKTNIETKTLEPKVMEVKKLTKQMKEQNEILQKINPTVYNAANQTMRFAAFFRYIKDKSSTSWNSFIEKIRSVKPEPSVKTPTQWKRQY